MTSSTPSTPRTHQETSPPALSFLQVMHLIPEIHLPVVVHQAQDRRSLHQVILLQVLPHEKLHQMQVIQGPLPKAHARLSDSHANAMTL